MVVAQEPLAADVGLQILKTGGTAVDAAVAVGFALAASYPDAGNLGGGGFMLVRMADGRTAFFDFREVAPQAATRDMYLGPDHKATKDSIFGWRSAAVPGTVAGLAAAHEKFGAKPWADLLAPAVHLARDGFLVSPAFANSVHAAKHLRTDPESTRIYSQVTTGNTFRQPELAATLARIAHNGPQDFYRGETARLLVEQMQKHGGLITARDLKEYRALERTPLTGTYKDFEVLTAPPPSAGGLGILQMLGILSSTGYDSDGPDSPKAIHYEAEAMRRFYADRSEYLGDPDFYNVPVRALLDPAYIARRRASILPGRASASDSVEPGLPTSLNARARIGWHEGNSTTHFNIVDAQGNAVAVTYTLNNSYGNGITVPGLGFLLNDEMDDFAAAPGSPNLYGLVGSDANAIEPGKRPLSSMNPTIVTRNGKLVLVIGAPGGSRITTGVLQVMLDILDFHMQPQEAIDLPRFHQQWRPDVLYVEIGFSKKTEAALIQMGYELRPIEAVARVEAISNAGSHLEGGTDGHGAGKVAAY